MPTAIQNPTSSDLAVVEALVPSTAGVPCGNRCLPIPADWHSRVWAGQQVAGCSYDIKYQADIYQSLLVSDLALSRLSNPAYTAGIPAQDLSDFNARLNPKRILLAGDSMLHGGYVLPTPANGTHPDGPRPKIAQLVDPRGRCIWVGWQNPATDATDGNALAVRPTWTHSAKNGARIDTHHYTPNMTLYGASGINPHIIACGIGTNDAGLIAPLATLTLSQWFDRYRQLINGKVASGDPLDGWHQRCPGAIFVLGRPSKLVATTQMNNGQSAALQQIHDGMDAAWDALVADGCTIIRVELNVITPAQPTAPYGGDYADDGVHPRYTVGTDKLAAAWATGISAALALIGGP